MNRNDQDLPRELRGLPLVNSFYDWTEDKRFTSDDEGNLVNLCIDHATGPLFQGLIDLAERGHADAGCEHEGCRANNRRDSRVSDPQGAPYFQRHARNRYQ